MSVSRETMTRSVDAALIVRLATLSKKGTPLLTPLWFSRDGDVIYLGTRRSSLHARHIRENPRVLMIFADDRAGDVLRVGGMARMRDIAEMSSVRKARMAWRYFLRPAALAHWAKHWRTLGLRRRYYAERTDGVMVEITLENAELVGQPSGRP